MSTLTNSTVTAARGVQTMKTTANGRTLWTMLVKRPGVDGTWFVYDDAGNCLGDIVALPPTSHYTYCTNVYGIGSNPELDCDLLGAQEDFALAILCD